MPTSSESVSFPPWLSFLLEPAFAALDQARAEITQIGVQLLAVPAEHLSKLKTRPQGRDPDPEDQAWLQAQRDQLATIQAREVSELRKQLVDVLGTVTVLRIELGDDVHADGLETLIERYKGYIAKGGKEEE